jgi:PAS domain S-box-containing protein
MLRDQFYIDGGVVRMFSDAKGSVTMHPIAHIDMVSILASAVALYLVLRVRILKSDVKFLVGGLILFSVLYYGLIFVGWAEISTRFEAIEDIIGAIVPMWWAFTLYAVFLGSMMSALADSEKRFKTLVTNIPGIFYRCRMDEHWTIIFVSNYMKTVTGYPASDFVGNSIRPYVSIIYEYDRQRIKEIVEGAAVSGEPFKLEYRVVHKDGHLIWMHEEGKVVKSDSGETLWLDGVIFDITERKNAEYEREVISKKLASKNEELESLIYVSSHDLKSPIVNIEGFSGELSKTCKELQGLLSKSELSEDDKKKMDRMAKEDISEDIRFINASSEKLKSLLDGMLKVSRISRTISQNETIAVSGLMKSITDAMTYQIRQNDARIKIGAIPNCVGDKALIGQVFTNLIDNALKYRDPSRPCVVTISGDVEKDRSIYCFEDNGLGIEENHLPRIFDLFHRLNPDDTVGGEGLGLTIIKRIVQLQNGDVWAESEFGTGSKFYISLPNS